jgi:uncharacterized protein
MSDRFTNSIEPFALATKGWTIEGKIPLIELGRLSDLVRPSQSFDDDSKSASNDIDGDAVFTLNFGIDEGGVPRIGGNVATTLRLQCQRCMEDMEYPVTVEVRLGIVPSREAAKKLPDNYDPLVVSDEEISIASILEDELILALPIVAMHDIENCSQDELGNSNSGRINQDAGQENLGTVKRENPFAVLAQLKETQLKKS